LDIVPYLPCLYCIVLAKLLKKLEVAKE